MVSSYRHPVHPISMTILLTDSPVESAMPVDPAMVGVPTNVVVSAVWELQQIPQDTAVPVRQSMPVGHPIPRRRLVPEKRLFLGYGFIIQLTTHVVQMKYSLMRYQAGRHATLQHAAPPIRAQALYNAMAPAPEPHHLCQLVMAHLAYQLQTPAVCEVLVSSVALVVQVLFHQMLSVLKHCKFVRTLVQATFIELMDPHFSCSIMS